ncbi:MAG: DUF2235 domain-containing protein [Paludibacteraceae bacterium]|nr:DUF2235 domain-containing protein [Paludibacteraceae bacterium]
MMKVGFDNPPKDNEKNEKKQPKDLKVLMGVFFDGTGNNKYNIDYYKNPKKPRTKWNDSYKSDYSNVAYEYSAYKHTIDGNPVAGFDYIRRVYITGIGTANRNIYLETDNLSDDMKKKADSKKEYKKNDSKSNAPENISYEGDSTFPGGAIGRGSMGVIPKIIIGCENIYKDLGLVIDVASEKNTINKVELSLDVYGFSRGAAAARCFINCITKKHGKKSKDKESLISYWLKKKGYGYSKDDKVEVSVKVRFVGLYDTVSSYGGGVNLFNFNDVKELGLDCPDDVVEIGAGVQFCAADEYRKNFSLTTVDSYGGKIKQYIFPGAHSDVGGGYERTKNEPLKVPLNFLDVSEILSGTEILAGFKYENELINEGWFVSQLNERTGKMEIEEYREVINTYSLIPLFIMIKKTREKGCDDIIEDDALSDPTVRLDEAEKDLGEIRKRLENIVFSGGNALYEFSGGDDTVGNVGKRIKPCFNIGDDDHNLVRSIRHRYIHLSSHTTIVHKPQKGNIREVING